MPFNASVRGTLGPAGLTRSRGLSVAASAGAPLSFLSGDYLQEFSSGYYGVDTEDSYIIPNNAVLESVTIKKQQSGFYHFWFLVATKSGITTSDNTYTFKYGALLPVPAGGSAGDVVTIDLSTALTSFGSQTIPSSGTHYIAWHSGSAGYPGATNPSGSMWWGDNYLNSYGTYRTRGGLSWMQSGTAPTLNSTFVGGTNSGFNYHSMGIAIKANYKISLSTSLVLDGSSPVKAATSARAIKELTGTTTNGYYWIKPSSYDVPRYVYCDMNSSGGGWMLIGWHGGGQGGANSHVSNNEWNSSFTLGSGAYSGANLTTPAPKNADSYGLGYRFIKSLVTGNRSSAVLAPTWSNDSGSTLEIYYYFSDSNADWGKYEARAAQAPSFSKTDPAYTWLRTGYTGYSTSGRNGGGSATGSTITYGDADWGVYPFNMNPGSYGNHGVAITGYYAAAPVDNPDYVRTYYGGHNANLGAWGRPVALWLKV